ncbi:MAG: hypothetical protein ACK40T_09210 [Akkermansiaceae bacterium]|jgi:hypothetical protein
MKQLEEFFEIHSRWKPLRRYLDRIRAFPDDGGIIVGNCKDLIESICKTILEDHFSQTLTGNERFQNLVRDACIKMGTLNQVASLASAFSNLATQLGTLRNHHADAGHGMTVTKLKQIPEEITEATSQCIITITEQIALFLLRVFEHEHPQRKTLNPLLLNLHLEFNEAFDEENDSVEIAGYGPYNASEILYSVDLTAYRTELQTYLAETATN